MKKEMTTKLKNRIFYIVLVGLLLVIGGSFAMFSANFIGEKYQVIDLKGIKFRYTEEDPAISMVNAKPMSDEEGKVQENYFDFNIYLESKSNYEMEYDILLEELDVNTINSKYVKVYLTDQNDNAIVGPLRVNDLNSEDKTNYLLYNTKITTEAAAGNTQYYRLRIWLADDLLVNTDYSKDGNTQTGTVGDQVFGFRVNVTSPNYSNVETKPSEPNAPVLASNMIPVTYNGTTWVKADSTNENNSWYDYENKIWANAVTVTSTNRDTYLKAKAGTPIPMEDINTMFVWIPRFSAEKGGILCSTIENPTLEKNLECYDKKSIDITDENKQQMAHGLYLYMVANGGSYTEEQVAAMMNNAIKENDTATINEGIEVYAQLLMMKHFSSFITLSTEDEALITTAFGTDFSQLIFVNDLEFYGFLIVLSQSNGEVTLTSDITIPNDDPLVKHYCDANGVTSEGCSYAIQNINSLDTNSKVVQMLGMTEDENVLNYFIAKSTDMVYDLSFNKKNLSNTKYNGGTIDAPGAFDITFVNKDTSAHDAFTFGSQNLSGIWVGKFENSSDTECSPNYHDAVGEGCNLNTIRPKILPNATSWRGAMVSTFFYDILAMTESGNQYGFDKTKDITLDTHMLKNNEWGAVAYLTQSIYGRCTSSTSCTEVGINNNSSYITGYGAPAGSDTSITNGTYETTLGMDASTTGNIYGVYDMSGGAYEYVMGVYTDGTKLWSGYSTSSNQHSGFNGWLYNDGVNYENGVAYPNDIKYYNVYTTETDYTNSGLQHALTETSYWYGDLASFVLSTYPWVSRGGIYNNSTSAGVFFFCNADGHSNTYYSSRSSIIIN